TSEILNFISTYLYYGRDLEGKSILVTAGANQEQIDPMRYITNKSSGKMGLALARAAHIRGAKVKLIYAAISEPVPEYFASEQAITASELHKSVINNYRNFETIIMAAAVADYTPANSSQQKIKKSGDLNIELKRTTDILAELGANKSSEQYLVGFAAESENITANAKAKLTKKKIDMIIANNLNVSGKDTTEIEIITMENNITIKGSKFEIAHKILEAVFSKKPEQKR
ncbi:MAG: phosphopantothenoylcysteine decarboxylase, partial [Candidatus Cloacimonetes bacterium]|nr:phosphopantothenoylcysteine decarboxylase [Candidatus Cloacimonadota bacterium]